jgi:hypothetical protein
VDKRISDLLIQPEFETSRQIKDQKNAEVNFCPNCINLVNDIYENSITDSKIFNKALISFVANHCYICFHNIRDRYRKKRNEAGKSLYPIVKHYC